MVLLLDEHLGRVNVFFFFVISNFLFPLSLSPHVPISPYAYQKIVLGVPLTWLSSRCIGSGTNFGFYSKSGIQRAS